MKFKMSIVKMRNNRSSFCVLCVNPSFSKCHKQCMLEKTSRISMRRAEWKICTHPLRQETILKILKGEMEEHDITAGDILVYEPGGRYNGYIPAVSVKPEHRIHLRSLLEDLLSYWCHHYPEIQLVKLYAVAWSEGGWDLVKHLFFSPRHDLGKDAFELDLGERNPSRLIKKYQECIKRKVNSTSPDT